VHKPSFRPTRNRSVTLAPNPGNGGLPGTSRKEALTPSQAVETGAASTGPCHLTVASRRYSVELAGLHAGMHRRRVSPLIGTTSRATGPFQAPG